MSRVFVHGWGAVSPAGWGRTALRAALDRGTPLPGTAIVCPGRSRPLQTRAVPPPDSRPSFLGHPRIRRTEPITHYLLGAALEALGQGTGPGTTGRLGLLVSVLSGCITYSRRFFEEVLANPATASPLLFPETVFNAPASHLAALLPEVADSLTFVGDDGAFLQALATAAQWLEDDRVDGCLVVGAEEADWLIADAMRDFSKRWIHAAGAGALCLRKEPPGPSEVELTGVTEGFRFTTRATRRHAAAQMRAQLPAGDPRHLLVLGIRGIGEDEVETGVWEGWPGERIAPKTVLGEAFNASTAWHCVAACEALARGLHDRATISVVGVNQQAIGACFERVH